jgi:hypothetical protein
MTLLFENLNADLFLHDLPHLLCITHTEALSSLELTYLSLFGYEE